jgi:hypothetical protein
MVRKQTWILLGVFVLLLGVTFYLQKNPLPKKETLTPSPTAQPRLLPGWQGSEIVWMELKESQGSSGIQIVQDEQGNWALGTGGKEKVDTGHAEQMREQFADISTTAALPANYQLDAIGLKAPARFLAIRNKQGKQATINIGNADPTDSGYYVQVDTQSPVVVDKFTLDGLVNLFNSALPTPTPAPESPTETGNPLIPTATPSP